MFDIPKKILVIAAHQDDETIGCGATIAKFNSYGSITKVLFVTNGETGISQNKDYSNSQIIKTRMDEAALAAEILRIHEIDTLNVPCQQVDIHDQRLFHDLIKQLRTFKPELVITHCSHDKHRDHRAISELVVEACWKSNENIHKKLGNTHSVKDIWGMEVVDPHTKIDFVVNVEESISKKIDAIKIYESQTKIIDNISDYILGLSKVRGYSIGTSAGEAFLRISKQPMKIL